ncbi:prospore membrane alpha-1,3-glucan synthase Mok12 [Schizosaccharomyces osmophilus]|uniref:alpha-1,3-glucan synthase n=1 Tax=Schizosaccharomyces osmophilus TaxID=2545709 RepID=A0AAE9WAU5_9SCHI|nr:prospore membrane alpha-1,3-glucan synthase Mok12 [Schizosaccharomyces osmophilus]WBW72795.1 prospore membrane alpha-1,3-glucan synthase Mok12 [Schizosaccharomyces osmophilus]
MLFTGITNSIYVILLFLFSRFVSSAILTDKNEKWNLNRNRTATTILDFYSEWTDHEYFPSPSNWRALPFYTVILDKWTNGLPENDAIEGTVFEHDPYEVTFRAGGDIAGLATPRSLDYLEGMGIKAIYVAGTPFENLPWTPDGYSPLDFTLLDKHTGTLQEWHDSIMKLHERGFYIVLDLTVSTLSELSFFSNISDSFANTSAPFSTNGYTMKYKNTQHFYSDFQLSNGTEYPCAGPAFWDITGLPINNTADKELIEQITCIQGDFDHYGDVEAFGNHPPWWRQLSNFASVQDRLRDWDPIVAKKLKHVACLAVKMLDVDGIRIDKATQITADFLGSWSSSVRKCAREVGKDNFFIPGEVTSGADFGSIYIGRGRQADQRPENDVAALKVGYNETEFFLRKEGDSALDSVSFHYSIYRAITLLLGLQGKLFATYDLNRHDFAYMWRQMLIQDDLINANTGKLDPRHLYGVTNQDIFRWPSTKDGEYKQLLGFFITHLLMPGIPLVYYGEEQNLKLLDNQAANYVFGRQPITSSIGWQKHGCYQIGNTQYSELDFSPASAACHDDWNSFDHLDPSSHTRNYISRMNEIRSHYPQIRDGWDLVALGRWTEDGVFPGNEMYAEATPTMWGLWSFSRGPLRPFQNFGNQSDYTWLLFSNRNTSKTFEFNCSEKAEYKFPPYYAPLGPFKNGTTIKNLLYPYEEITLSASTLDSPEFGNIGCIPRLEIDAYGSKVFVKKENWLKPSLYLTDFLPGHDHRVYTSSKLTSINISLGFSEAVDCHSLAKKITINTHTLGNYSTPKIEESSISCALLEKPATQIFTNAPATRWYFNATLEEVPHGLHELVLEDIKSTSNRTMAAQRARLLLRVGNGENPMVYPSNATFSKELLHIDDGDIYVNHTGIGADKYRYSLNFGSTFSPWKQLTSASEKLNKQHWNGSHVQGWDGEHVIVQYWSSLAMSTAHIQHGDSLGLPRQFPHLFVQGAFNRFGYDGSIPSKMRYNPDNRTWTYELISTWPAQVVLNVWGMNPDNNADEGWIYGDLDNDTIIDRVPPGTSRISNFIRFLDPPPKPYLSYKMYVNDFTRQLHYVPKGSWSVQIICVSLLIFLPPTAATLSVLLYGGAFSRVTIFNGSKSKGWKGFKQRFRNACSKLFPFGISLPIDNNSELMKQLPPSSKKRNVLVATLEYDIPELGLRVKIGGLGVMAQLMSQHLEIQDMVWVIPIISGLEYPFEQFSTEPKIEVKIHDVDFVVNCYSYKMNNITYIFVQSEVFYMQSTKEPYPSKMDDLNSAMFYSTWNQCIAEVWRRYPLDIYHANDYHGALAPLYLLPEVIPVAVSLHNAEFQGLWPLRKAEEVDCVCSIFNISREVCAEYVQFGHVFNLLHSIISYVRKHQGGYGVVAVSDKYSKQSLTRYPIFWSLVHISGLPNPDPSDLNMISNLDERNDVDFVLEAKRKLLKRQTQEWAGLDVDPSAQLLVFVGRWSQQKGIDLIADLAPKLLAEYNVQIITIGPVIDLHGQFAAEKLQYVASCYPNRVFSRPVFTAVPPFLFAGADFALIPSRDEPFGLVAVEFGRKGVLCIGSRTGGLGYMPGWWFQMASPNTGHLLAQFENAISKALQSPAEMRARLRAEALRQRFPVCVWKQKTDDLLKACIYVHEIEEIKKSSFLYKGYQYLKSAGDQVTSKFSRNALLRREESAEPALNDNSPIRNEVNAVLNEPYISESSPKAKEETEEVEFYSIGDVLNSSQSASPYSSEESVVEQNDRSFDNFARDLQTHNYANTREVFDIQETSEATEEDTIRDHVIPVNDSSVDFENLNADKYNAIVESKPVVFHGSVTFTDEDGNTRRLFLSKLDDLTSNNTMKSLSIDHFIRKHERKYFSGLRKQETDVRLNFFSEKDKEKACSITETVKPLETETVENNAIQKIMLHNIGSWPLYTIILAIGQILGASSYQLTLLSGESAQSTNSMYILLALFSAFSLFWWFLSRFVQGRYILSLPFLCFGLSFFLVSITHFFQKTNACSILQHIAAYVYAISSSTGSLYFAWNFGAEGGIATHHWIVRACLVHGVQQIWSAILWAWGDLISKKDTGQKVGPGIFAGGLVASVACFCLAYVTFVGLPTYYRQSPSIIPAFYRSLSKRSIVLWFFIAQILSNYWLAVPYGQAWRFFWNTSHTPFWGIVVLLLIFFIAVWIIVLYGIKFLSLNNVWFPVIFGLGLLCPRWCLEFWSSSGLGLNLPWAGRIAPVLTKLIWLYLALWDGIQGIGIGVMLLQTLARDHVAFTLMLSQVVSSLTIMVAKPTIPVSDKVFPNLGAWNPSEGPGPCSSPCFYIALICQIIAIGGLFYYYRKSQLAL